MRIGGRAAAMQIAAEFGGRLWLLKIGYDEEFSRCSPGTLLMLETLRYAAVRGLSAYEFLGTEEPWTRVWTQKAHPCLSVRIYPATRAGMTALVTDFGRITWCKTAGRARFRL
jgi:CelD/BcsL family acetyltransferase involved in cellulose biosynthesis